MICEKLSQLGTLLEQAPTSEQARALAKEIRSACTTPEDERMIEDFVGARMAKLTAHIDNLYGDAIKQQLSEIGGMLNLAYIAKTYFKKSRTWLSQRVNGNSVNGKPCRFTAEELDTLNFALRDMATRLSSVTVGY